MGRAGRGWSCGDHGEGTGRTGLWRASADLGSRQRKGSALGQGEESTGETTPKALPFGTGTQGPPLGGWNPAQSVRARRRRQKTAVARPTAPRRKP